jgi:hypothetical protein
MARTAYATLPNWKRCCEILENITDDMPGRFLSTKIANPPCWDSPPFAYNLKLVAESFKPTPVVDVTLKASHFINKSRQRLATAAASVLLELRRTRLRIGRRQVQKKFAGAFKETLLPPTLEPLLCSRFTKHFASVCQDGFSPDWAGVASCLKRAQPHYAMVALKTLLNSWCTNGRYHDSSSEEYIFGYLAKDDITHYVCCPVLWGICERVPGASWTEDVEARILLRDASQAKLTTLVTAFTTYHARALGTRPRYRFCPMDQDWCGLRPS